MDAHELFVKLYMAVHRKNLHLDVLMVIAMVFRLCQILTEIPYGSWKKQMAVDLFDKLEDDGAIFHTLQAKLKQLKHPDFLCRMTFRGVFDEFNEEEYVLVLTHAKEVMKYAKATVWASME